MLKKIFWDVFQKTGSIEAYLASKECEHNDYDLEISKEVFPNIKSEIYRKDIKKDE
ncbi:YqzL family protein [Defluviitalea phaphyphila]|uniref:YqzL family protein n=1 Tax=Defluviitalea phaphyphila TaxID=1473580 RepID=UPI001187581F|nr:YqzL family protein [Defluviitalea phaphyphila]